VPLRTSPLSRLRDASLADVSRAAALWTFGYAAYRAYYAAGGTVGMPGTPASYSAWRRVNAIGSVLLFATAALAILFASAWAYRRARPFLLAFCWIAAVGCVSHALIDVAQRVASLSGALVIDYPFWRTIDRSAADLQDLFFNEPWFLVEGILWAAIAWKGALESSPRRRWWIASVVVATFASTAIGLLTAFGVIRQVIVG
jgi:hypothetical protein